MAIFDDYLVDHSESLVEMNTPNTRKGAFRQLFFVFGLASLIFDSIFILSGHSFFEMFYAEYDMAIFAWILNLPAIVTFILWRTTKPSRLFFDRQKKAIRLITGKTDVLIPWSTIQFEVHWIPTKLGGINYLAMKAGPPFPGVIAIKNARKLEKTEKGLFLGLGGFDCRNSEIAEAYIRFFSGLMTSNAPIGDLYQATVAIAKRQQ